MNFFLLLPSGDYFLLPDGGRLIIGSDTPAPPTPTPTPAPSGGRGGGIPGDFATGRKPETLHEATRKHDERRLEETKTQLKAILADDAEVMQIIEAFIEAHDKN